MKIIYVVHQFSPHYFSGTEMYTFDLAREMSRRGNDVCVVSMAHRRDYKSPKYNYKKQIDFIKIKNKRNHLEEFRNILCSFKPDIVHFQHLQYFSPRIIELTKNMDIPLVLHLHDYFYICKRIRLLTRDGNVCAKATNCPACETWRAKWQRYIENIDLIIANSQFTRDAYLKSGFAAEKIIVDYCGIDLNRISKMEHSRSIILRFGFLGTIIKDKGIEVLLEAFNKLDNSVSLEIWGRINGSYRANILKRIKNSAIEIKGEYDQYTIRNVLSRLDVVVIPSIWPETWSIVKSEALAAGLGVLASSIGGIREGINGYKVLLFKPNNVSSLLGAIKSVVANKYVWKTKKNMEVRIKTIKENAREMEHIYTRLSSSCVKLSPDRQYIVNSKIIFWSFKRGDIYISKSSRGRSIGYILRDVARRFWELFTEFKSFDDIVNTISIEYSAEREHVQVDIKSLMNELLREEIIVEASTP